MKISRQVGTLNEILNVYVQNATVSTGAGLANIVASSVLFSWCRNNQATISSGTCTTGTLGTYGVSSFVQANATSSLGWYHFSPPNGVFASGGSCFIHLYGAPNMAPVPIEVELTKTDNQNYLSTQTVSTLLSNSDKAGYTVTGGVGISSMTLPVGVSSKAGVSTLVGVSSGTWLAGVSTVTDKGGYGVSTKVGVSTLVGVSSGTWLTGVSSFDLAVGVSSFTIPVGVSSMTSSGLFNFFSVNGGNYSSAAANSVVKQIADNAGGSSLTDGSISTAVWAGASGVHVTSTAIEFGVSTIVPVGVSSGRISISTLVGVSSGTWLAGVSTVTDKTGYSGRVSVSTLVGVSTLTIPVGVSTGSVNVSAFAFAVGVSSFGIAVGVSSNADKVNYTLDSTYGPAGSISTNIVQVRGIAVGTGTGTSSDPWGP